MVWREDLIVRVWREDLVVWRQDLMGQDLVIRSQDLMVWRQELMVWRDDLVVRRQDLMVWRQDLMVWGEDLIVCVCREGGLGRSILKRCGVEKQAFGSRSPPTSGPPTLPAAAAARAPQPSLAIAKGPQGSPVPYVRARTAKDYLLPISPSDTGNW